MSKKPIKETIHAKGIDIGIYTNDFNRVQFEAVRNEAVIVGRTHIAILQCLLPHGYLLNFNSIL